MSIYIESIDAFNINEVKNLKIAKKQVNFIETITDCLKEAKKSSQWHPVAIYKDDYVVGFAMYGCFGENKETWIDRILIDEQHQRKGFGREAMKLLINLVLNKYNINIIYLSIVKENDIARILYEELGFHYTFIDDLNGELIFRYKQHQGF
ncbi:GNAT family N-acetyltransferase [Staphylococcus equorum]|uniref:GNAT family N-acetyltransferase n=1 Tax=Staphylococcus equorum TaxID=246432 RepID=UPI0009BF5746|nr:GNAT family N-acetyltransferase [Staphylococcus equorum]